jgi:hypothetical protein
MSDPFLFPCDLDESTEAQGVSGTPRTAGGLIGQILLLFYNKRNALPIPQMWVIPNRLRSKLFWRL